MGIVTPECQCGCGKSITIATRSWFKRGIIRGEPLSYLPGHQKRKHLANDPVGTKTCSRCPENGPQSIRSFGKSKRSPDGHRPECKACRTIDSAKYYRNLDEAQKTRIKKQLDNHLAINRSEILKRFATGCSDCDERDIKVLEFDHVKGTKAGNIATLMRSGSLRRLMIELDKCEVVCANCHRRRTIARDPNWREGALS